MASKSFGSKGKRGQHKRYYKGKYSRHKSKQPVVQFGIGMQIVFLKDSQILVGYVSEVIKSGHYMVSPNPNSQSAVKHIVSKDNQPKLASSLRLDANLIQLSKEVLTIWDFMSDFMILIPTKIVQISDSNIWVRPSPDTYPHAVNVELSALCINPYPETYLSTLSEWNDEVDAGDVSFISSMFKITQRELQTVQAAYNAAHRTLSHVSEQNEVVERKYLQLNSLHVNAKETIRQLTAELHSIQNVTSKKIASLEQIVAKQRQALSEYKIALHAQNQQVNETQIKWRSERRKVTNLIKENDELKIKIMELSQEKSVQDLTNKSTRLMEMRPSTSSDRMPPNVVMSRKLGSTKRHSAYIPVVLPDVSSSEASARSLENRAKQLTQVSAQ